MSIIGLQRRLVQVGRIRLGEQVPITKKDGTKGTRPARLEKWRLTSRDEVRLTAAAAVFGGTVRPWEERPGEFELYTEVDALPVLLLPGQAISQWYELWSGGGCKRRCDGQQEQISDGACLCNPDERECKPHTRLNVLLPDVAGIGCWRLDTQGYYAATELTGTVELLELATARGVLLPARLRIDQRVILRDGETRRFPVPTLDIDIRPLEMQAITRAAAGELEQENFKPIAALPSSGVSLSEGLAAANGQTEQQPQTGRSAAPIGLTADFLADNDKPIPIDDDAVAVDAPKTETKRPPKITADQKKKLNVLVGTLREAGRLHTEHLYMAVAKLRDEEDPEGFVEHGKDERNELHYAPLRDSLTKDEASNLIDRLERLESAAPA